MDNNQTLDPGSAGPFAHNSAPIGGPIGPMAGGGGGKPAPIIFVLLLLLGLGTAGFGILTLTFATKASTATKTLEAQKAAAAAAAKDEQKKADDAAALHANESPFRAYTAPGPYGGFVISFPKTWSSYVDEEPQGTQVKLILNPEFIRRINGTDQKNATQVTFIEQTKEKYLSQFAGNLKKGAQKQSDTTVSGQAAYNLTGTFPDRRTVHMVVVPVRDKVLVFSNENSQYEAEFNQILSQAKINP
jgi:hypothetical protein